MTERRSAAVSFDGTFEGFLCIVHAYYYEGISPTEIFPESTATHQPTLETPDEFHITTDLTRACKVHDAIGEKISAEAFDYINLAFLSNDTGKYMSIFQYILLGFKIGHRVDDHLQQDYVLETHKLARNVGGEAHLLTGFCRFAETTSGVYYCKISPKNHTLPILAEHFRDRMSTQPWIIHDKKRSLAAIYDGKEYIITPVPRDAAVENSDNEAFVQDLWKTFFNALAIKERKNLKLQRNNLPLHFRKFMTEFN